MRIAFVVLLSGVACGNVVQSRYDTIVVGLGAAGVTAGTTLAREGRRVLALDAAPTVGGRVRTRAFAQGVVEEGAEWLHGTTGHPAYNLAVKNNVTISIQNHKLRMFSSTGTEANGEFIKNAYMWYDENRDYEDSDTPELMGDYFITHFRNYVNNTYPEFSNNTDLVNELLAFFRLDSCVYEGCNDWNDVTTQSNYQLLEGDQDASFHRHGYKTFFDMLLNTYNNGTGVPNLEMKLNEEVSRITWPQDSSRPVVVTTAAGTEYQADNVIVTVSVGVLKERYQSLFSPELPQGKVDAIYNISMGVVDKIILGFAEVWWPTDSGFCGFLWRGEDKRALAGDWTTQISGFSRSMGSDFAIAIWTNGYIAKLIETLPEDEVKTKSMQLIRRFMGVWAEQQNITIPEPTGMIRSQWYSNPFTRGSYSFDGVAEAPGARAALATPLLDSAGAPRVLFAGEASNVEYYSTVHGASDTGYREAMRLLDYKAE